MTGKKALRDDLWASKRAANWAAGKEVFKSPFGNAGHGLRGFLAAWEGEGAELPPRGDNRLNWNLGAGAKWKLGRHGHE